MPQDDTDREIPLRPNLTTLVQAIKRSVKLGLWVGMPGTVESFAPAKPGAGPIGATPATVDVVLDLRYIRRGRREDVGEREEWAAGNPPEPGAEGDIWGDYPVLRAVPVHYSGHMHMSIRGPIEAGEVGWVNFCQRSLDRWTSDGAGFVPPFRTLLGISDAVFVPGLRHGAAAPAPVIPDASSQIGPEDGTAGLEISHGPPGTPREVVLFSGEAKITIAPDGSVTVEGTTVKLGANATEAVLKGTTFMGLFNAHTHTTAAPFSPTGPVTPPVVPASVLSTKVSTE